MRFVLVHGGWQGGWCWDAVAAGLRGAGHQVLNPTLRGSEPDDPAGSPVDRDVDLSTVGDDLVARITASGWDDVVLVGHSGGGPTVQYAADRLLPRVRRLVFVDAWVLRDGEATVDVQPHGEAFRAMAAQDPGGGIELDVRRWSEDFMNGAPPGLLAATTPRLVPLPLRQLVQPIRLPRLRLGEPPGSTPEAAPPTSYVFLRQDRAVDPAVWRRMAARLGTAREVGCDGPHEAMLTHPRDLCEALLAAT